MVDPLISLLIAVFLTAVGLWLFWPESGLFWRWRHDQQLTERVLREDALKHVYQSEMDGDKPSVKSLAGELSIPISQAAQLLNSLQVNELLENIDGNLRLTHQGRDYALRVVRAHRLYERYLADETGYEEAEWHTKAHQQEHNLSVEDVAMLSARLGNPTHDPHGDPIPTANGFVAYQEKSVQLPALGIDQTARIIHLEDEPEAIYAQLIAEGLHVGQTVRMLEVTAQRVRFWGEGDEHILAPILAANIAVLPIPDESPEEAPLGETLTTLKSGRDARIIGLSPRIRGVERRRLMDLGILPGTSVTAELVSAGGDPTAYRIRGALIALRKTQTDQIFIAPQES